MRCRLRQLGLCALLLVAACRAPRTFIEVNEPTSPLVARTGNVRPLDPAAHAEPPPAEASAVELEPQGFVLDNGMRVALLARQGVPMVTLDLSYDSGRDDGPDGLAALAAYSWVDDQDVGFTFPALAANETRRISSTRTALHVQAPIASLDPLLSHYAAMVVDPKPVFSDLAFQKRRVAGDLRGVLVQPQAVALSELGRRLGDGTSSEADQLGRVENLARDDANAFLRSRITPRRTMLTLVGAFQTARARDRITALFGNWKATESPPSTPRELAPSPASEGLTIIDRPGASQTVIAIGAWVPGSLSPAEWHDADALAAVLGGPLTARADARVRLHGGDSYGAHAFVWRRRGGGVFALESSVDVEQTAASLRAYLDVLRSGREQLPSAAELAAARARVFGPGAVSATGLCSWLDSWMDTMEPFETFVSRTARTDASKPEAIRSIARRILGDERLRIVLAGDSSKIVPQLASANLGTYRFAH